MHSKIALLTLIFSAGLASAQPAEEEGKKDTLGQNVGWEAGFHLGDLLPNQIGGVSEIMGLGGVRAGYRISKDNFVEAGFMSGNGGGAKWKNISASFRLDLPLETMVGTAFIGPDMTYYSGEDVPTRLVFGGHAGGGILSQLGGLTWFRADMTFNISPGTSLYISLGFIFRFPGGASGSGEG